MTKKTSERFYELKPKTDGQVDYIRTVAENIITLVNGPSGCGKSFIATALACEGLRYHKYDKVLVTRTLVGCDNDIGSLPGMLDERIAPYMGAYAEYFNLFLGKQTYENYVRSGGIVYMPIELLRGQTYNNTFMLCEEAQNCTVKQLKLFLTRIGHNSKLVLAGDRKQSDIHNSGFSFCLDKMLDIPNVGLVNLSIQDIVRNGIIGHIIEIFEKNGY